MYRIGKKIVIKSKCELKQKFKPKKVPKISVKHPLKTWSRNQAIDTSKCSLRIFRKSYKV